MTTYYTDYFNDDNWFLDKATFEANKWNSNNSWNIFVYYNYLLSAKLIGIPTKYQNPKIDKIFIETLKGLAQQQVTTLITLYPSQETIFNYLNLGKNFVNSSSITHQDIDLDVVKQNVNPTSIDNYTNAFSINLEQTTGLSGTITNNLKTQDGVKDYHFKEQADRHDDGLVRDSFNYKSDFIEAVDKATDDLVNLMKPTFVNGGSWKWTRGYGKW